MPCAEPLAERLALRVEAGRRRDALAEQPLDDEVHRANAREHMARDRKACGLGEEPLERIHVERVDEPRGHRRGVPKQRHAPPPQRRAQVGISDEEIDTEAHARECNPTARKRALPLRCGYTAAMKFRLVPFPAEPSPTGVVIEGEVSREGAVLHANFRVTVPAPLTDQVIVPVVSTKPARRDGLWKHTCVELFAAPHARAGYLEVNLSPSGDWNTYRFAGYRDGMTPLEPARCTARLTDLPDGLPGTPLTLGFTLVLPGDMAGESLDVGISAVLEHPGMQRTYWSLIHPGDRPDFHRRDALIIAL